MPKSQIFNVANIYFNTFGKNKILTKISKSIVDNKNKTKKNLPVITHLTSETF